MKKRRQSLNVDLYEFESFSGSFSARKVPKKDKWRMKHLSVSLKEMLRLEQWTDPGMFQPVEAGA